MGLITTIIVIILGIIITTGYVIIRIVLTKKTVKVDVTPNMPLIENPCRQKFTDGYYLGVLKSQLPRKNGCTLIEFYPLDDEQGEYKPKPQVQSLIVKNEFIKRFSRGEPSARREIIMLIGRDPSDYPKKMRDTKRKWMEKEGQLAFLQSTFKKSISAGDEAIVEMMSDFARGQMTKAQIQRYKEIAKMYQEMKLTEPEVKKEEK